MLKVIVKTDVKCWNFYIKYRRVSYNIFPEKISFYFICKFFSVKEAARTLMVSLNKEIIFSNKANGFLNTSATSAIQKHCALTNAQYKRSEFRTRGDINVMRLINRTEPGVNLDACV